RQVHAEHHHLIHRMVEAQVGRGHAADLQLVADIAGREEGRRETDQGVQNDKDNVQVVDAEKISGRGPVEHQKRGRGDEGQERGGDVDPRTRPVAWQQCQQCRPASRQDQNGREGVRAGHRRSPLNSSSDSRSTESNRSRMRNRKTPMSIIAISTENATLISTTSGMPCAPAAARIRPFSSDMKPTTCVTALRRVTIISMPSRITESAKARSSRASAFSADSVSCSIRRIESATSPMPASIVGTTPVTTSTSRWMPRRCTIRCKAQGTMVPLKTSASAAEA